MLVNLSVKLAAALQRFPGSVSDCRPLLHGIAVDIEILRSQLLKTSIRQFSSRNVHPDDLLLPQVTIIGRPNVGKSALFNRLLRRAAALVYDTPGSHVTRDYKEGIGKIGDLRFRVIDTSGLEPDRPHHSIQGRAIEITSRVLKKSDLTLLVVDAKAGLLASDEDLAQWLKKHVNIDKVVVVANKAENQRARQGMSLTVHDCYRLGFGEPVAISASTGEGMADLYVALQPFIDERVAQIKGHSIAQSSSMSISENGFDPSKAPSESLEASVKVSVIASGRNVEAITREDKNQVDDEEEPTTIRLAILGQPNVGKSTLLNSILQEPRSLTGSEPGLTRDAVHAMMEHNGVQMELVDTAGWIGITRSAKYDDVGGMLADMARRESARALAAAHVALLVVDAERAVRMQRVLTQKELALADLALTEGRALVVAANKLDVLRPQDRATYLSTLSSTLEERFLEAGKLPIVGISALMGQGVEALLPTVEKSFRTWNKRVSTGRLNRFVRKLHAQLVGGAGGTGSLMHRIKYMTQVKARPPSFAAFMSGSQPVEETFVKFLAAKIREALGFHGVPIRIWFRYKEARSAQCRTENSRQGRSLAFRGSKQRQKMLRVAKEAPSATFQSHAKNILGKIAPENAGHQDSIQKTVKKSSYGVQSPRIRGLPSRVQPTSKAYLSLKRMALKPSASLFHEVAPRHRYKKQKVVKEKD